MHSSSSVVSERYMALIAAFRLRPIQTKADYDLAIRVMESLMLRGDLADDEEEYSDVLCGLIEAYEEDRYPIPDASGVNVLRFLVEHSGRTQAQIAKDAGLAESTVSEILKKKRGLGRKHIEAFSRVFHIDAGAFLPAAEQAKPARTSKASRAKP